MRPSRLPEILGIKSLSLAVEIFDPGRLARTLGSENKHYPAGPCVARTLVQSFLVISLTSLAAFPTIGRQSYTAHFGRHMLGLWLRRVAAPQDLLLRLLLPA